MNLAKEITIKIESLPDDNKIEILDYVQYLSKKINDTKNERSDWKEFSLKSAMRDLEDEEELYSMDDIKEEI